MSGKAISHWNINNELFIPSRYAPELDIEQQFMRLFINQDSEGMSEERVRQIIREELLEFKLEYLRDGALFQKILNEIREERRCKKS